MKKIRFHTLNIALALILLATGVGYFVASYRDVPLVFAGADEVDISFDSDPLFYVTNMLPGDVLASKKIKVENNSGGDDAYNLYFAAIQTNETSLLAGKPSLVIEDEHGVPLFSSSFQELFDLVDPGHTSWEDLDDNDGISLQETLSPGEEKTFTFKVEFPFDAGNEYQGLTTIFDGVVGWIGVEGDDEELLGGSVLGAATSLPGTGASFILSGFAVLGIGLILRKFPRENA